MLNIQHRSNNRLGFEILLHHSTFDIQCSILPFLVGCPSTGALTPGQWRPILYPAGKIEWVQLTSLFDIECSILTFPIGRTGRGYSSPCYGRPKSLTLCYFLLLRKASPLFHQLVVNPPVAFVLFADPLQQTRQLLIGLAFCWSKRVACCITS
jgi:hypothetical protein